MSADHHPPEKLGENEDFKVRESQGYPFCPKQELSSPVDEDFQMLEPEKASVVSTIWALCQHKLTPDLNSNALLFTSILRQKLKL